MTARNGTAKRWTAALAALVLAASGAGCADGGSGVTAPGGESPAEPLDAISTSGYTAVVGDDWKAYRTRDDLRAAQLFWWYRSEDVMQEVDLVPDATFGQVARIRFRQSDETGWAPKMDAALPQPLDRAWYRWRMKYSPGWSTVGPNPSGYANSYKVAFWLWDGYEGRGQVELSNTNQYILGFGVNQNGTYMRYTERQLPGSQSFGNVSTEWSDGEWWEFVAYYEKTGATSARQHWWKRRLTNGGAVANNPWTYIGLEVTGATTPRVRSIRLGANRNKSNPSTMYISWGPWEVVDGTKHPNPFGMPWQSGQPSTGGTTTQPPAATPTLSRVVVGPATATAQTGGTVQFTATGQYSDGTSKALAVGWTAGGGTVSTGGLYTAGQTAGTFRVIGRDAASGLADTSAVTVSAPASAPVLTRVVVGPATATAQTGGTVQFTATGQYSDGTSKSIAVGWTAGGGTVSTGGLYTAGQTAGTFRVIGRDAATGRADTSAVTVSAPAAPPASGTYAKLLGDDWKSYTSTSQLSGYYSSSDLSRVALVSDPVFGRALRLTHAAGSTASPRLTKSLPAAADRVWYRWRVRYSPGWSTGGGSWTMGRFGWSGFQGESATGLAGTSHQLAFNVRDAKTWAYHSYAETRLSSSTGLGGVGTEFSDGQWYEYVMLWEKTGATTGRSHWWTRRLTANGAVSPGAWRYYGIALSGSTTPRVSQVSLGATGLSRAPAATQYAFWGPWEVVDGTKHANPFTMPGF